MAKASGKAALQEKCTELEKALCSMQELFASMSALAPSLATYGALVEAGAKQGSSQASAAMALLDDIAEAQS